MEGNARTRFPIARIRSHPRQAELFGVPAPEEVSVRALAISMESEGLREPIHILPDGTILAGHRRVAAARRLGWPDIEVQIRHDLADSPERAEQFLIADNIERRQLDRVALARLYLELKRIGRQVQGDRRQPAGIDARELIGRQLGLRGRTLDRLASILTRCPPAIVKALEDKRITQQLAEQIGGLDPEAKEQIADAIGRGESPRNAARPYLDAPRKDLERWEASRRFIKKLNCVQLEYQRIRSALPEFDANEKQILARHHEFITRLLESSAAAI